MSLRNCRWAKYTLWFPILLVGCAGLQPEDAAPALPFRVDVEVEARFPGARSVIDGVDMSGERALRDGDRVLVGVEVAAGESVKRHLLELIVHRGAVGESEGIMTFTASPESGVTSIPQRSTRVLDLELVLRAPDGREVERSRLSAIPEFALDEDFVAAIQRSQGGDKRSGLIAELRLALIAQMLNGDPILQSLLREAASIPWDPTLLWRRELHLEADLQAARAATAADGRRPRYELPFDLFLNDSLLVRMMATVTAPHGAAGAVGGIVGLRAQDARNPDHYLSLHILGAARGPKSEWQQYGVLTAHGYSDEGKGVAFSPGGRWVAMPGAGSQVEVRDLQAQDPTVPRVGECAGTVLDLAFLDDGTLLAMTKERVTVFDVRGSAGKLRELAAHVGNQGSFCALEVGDAATAFVGSHGTAVECWRFAADRSAAPRRELLQEPRTVPLDVDIDRGTGKIQRTTVKATIAAPFGWLFAVDAARVLVRTKDDEVEWRHTAGGQWGSREMERVASPMARRSRDPDASAMPMFDAVSKGMSMVRCDAIGTHAFGAGPVSLTNGGGTRAINRCAHFRSYCHGFSPDGRFYAFVSPGYRALVETERFLAPQPANRR